MEEKKLQSMLNSLQAQQSFGKEYAKSLQTKLVAGTGTNVETLKLNHKEAAIRARQRQVLKYPSAHDCKKLLPVLFLLQLMNKPQRNIAMTPAEEAKQMKEKGRRDMYGKNVINLQNLSLFLIFIQTRDVMRRWYVRRTEEPTRNLLSCRENSIDSHHWSGKVNINKKYRKLSFKSYILGSI